MLLTDFDLRNIDENYINSVDIDTLRKLSKKLLEDLKEAREQISQNPKNSSRPPSSVEPWIKAEIKDDEEEIEFDGKINFEKNKSSSSSDDSNQDKEDIEKNAKKEKKKDSTNKRKAGKQEGAKGVGRTQKIPVTETVKHIPEECSVCGGKLNEENFKPKTGHYVIDIIMGDENNPGIILTNTKHIYGDTICTCGHINHTEPHRCEKEEDWDVELTEWHLVGPNLMALICCLAMRMRLSRNKIREFLKDWLHLSLAIGTINQCIHESGRACEPLKEQLLEEIRKAHLVFADETSWKEKGIPYWLWAFKTARTALFTISHRTKETVEQILGDFSGWLMSDGYNAYRDYINRLRCWAHLTRKAEGISESLNLEAQKFGEEVLNTLNSFMEAVYQARKGSLENLKIKYKDHLERFRAVCEKFKNFAHNKDGKIYEKTQALAREFLNDWEAIFRVLGHPELPLTNNEVERILRHWVILRRICYGTRNKQGSRVLTLLASVIETCRLRNILPWPYLSKVISNRRKGIRSPPIPSAVII